MKTPFSLSKEREERFQWSEVYRGIFNVQVWLSSTAYFAILSGLYSFGLFVRLALRLGGVADADSGLATDYRQRYGHREEPGPNPAVDGHSLRSRDAHHRYEHLVLQRKTKGS